MSDLLRYLPSTLNLYQCLRTPNETVHIPISPLTYPDALSYKKSNGKGGKEKSVEATSHEISQA